MKNNEPYLLIELNDKNFIFFVVQFNENGELRESASEDSSSEDDY